MAIDPEVASRLGRFARAYQRAKENPDEYLQAANRLKELRRQENIPQELRRWLNAIANQPCYQCKYHGVIYFLHPDCAWKFYEYTMADKALLNFSSAFS